MAKFSVTASEIFGGYFLAVFVGVGMALLFSWFRTLDTLLMPLVVSLNMAGGVPDAADFVVTDPVQAGVMAVMAVAETARFKSDRLKRRVF